jgi:cardiolipin synthase
MTLSIKARVPNALSLSRVILAVPLLIVSRHLDTRSYIATISIVVVASITDALDGFLCRRWTVRSEVGYVLDAMGDRAIHLALLLSISIRYGVDPIFIWLLVFRDMAVYAIRVLTKDWFTRSLELRWLSVLHATNLRLWFALFLLRDGFRVIRGSDILDTFVFKAIQMSLLCGTIILAYYGLVRSVGWTRDRKATGT